MRILAALAAIAVLAPAAAFSGTNAAAPGKLVLQGTDLPTGVKRTRARTVTNVAANRETPGADDFAKLGRATGFEVEYKRVSIVLELESAAHVFMASFAAREGLTATIRSAQAGGPRFTRLRMSDSLGHEVRLYKGRATRAGAKLDVFLAVWRSARVVGVLRATAAAGTLAQNAFVELARKQQQRIARNG